MKDHAGHETAAANDDVAPFVLFGLCVEGEGEGEKEGWEFQDQIPPQSRRARSDAPYQPPVMRRFRAVSFEKCYKLGNRAFSHNTAHKLEYWWKMISENAVDAFALMMRAVLIAVPLTPALLYLPFRLSLSGASRMGRWDCLPACRREGSGVDEFVALWHWFLTKCAGSQNRSPLCPKLEPLIERPSKASSYLQE